jgi:DNA-binding winged helix-turn-helix (wHTH) protein/tetratricopeptide (TPR) repeat protein
MSAPVDLTKTLDFTLGRLTVKPSTLQVEDSGVHETLEPRIMQVLVALHQANGQVVSRDDLIAQCWDGRVVSDDAINRTIGKLRRLAETGGSFIIETVPRVGYRLVAAPAAAPVQADTVPPPSTPASAPSPASAPPPSTGLFLNRRAAFAGTAVVAAAALGWQLLRPRPQATPPAGNPADLALLQSGFSALGESTAEGVSRAMAIFQQVIARDPASADAWGGLAMAMSFASHITPNISEAMLSRAREALRRATEIDPHNQYATMARANLTPLRGNWAQRERIFRAGLRFHPQARLLLQGLAYTLANVGRMAQAADAIVQATAAAASLDPDIAWLRIHLLWAANRLLEADKAASEGIALFPRQRFVWFSRLYMLMYSGRLSEAQSNLANVDGRPLGVPDRDFDELTVVVAAMQSRAKADIDRAVAEQMEAARRGVGYAENAIQFLCFLGKVDEAFAIAQANYFGVGFTVADVRFSKQEGAFTFMQDRRTVPLFVPATKAMRKDKRFPLLTQALGLDRYWAQANVLPDYRINGDM